jgi:hypothetical protein
MQSGTNNIVVEDGEKREELAAQQLLLYLNRGRASHRHTQEKKKDMEPTAQQDQLLLLSPLPFAIPCQPNFSFFPPQCLFPA